MAQLLPHKDVVIMGLGWTGSILAQELTDAGLHVVIAPTGGQGALLGRGNQQLTTRVLRQLGPDRLIVVATRTRLAALSGRPLLVDLDDEDVARQFTGMRKVVVGPRHTVVYPVVQP